MDRVSPIWPSLGCEPCSLVVLMLVCWSAFSFASAQGKEAELDLVVGIIEGDVSLGAYAMPIQILSMDLLRQEFGAKVVLLEDALRGQAYKEEAQQVAQATRELASAISDYDSLELGPAVRKLETVVRIFEALPVLTTRERNESYQKALTYLGAARALLGHNIQARKAFRKLLSFDLESRLDAKVFPPGIVRIFDVTQKKIAQLPKTGKLFLESDPSGAAIFLDGEFQGITPCEGKELTPGEHRLVVSKLGFEPMAKKALLEADKTLKLNWTLVGLNQERAFRNDLKVTLDKLETQDNLPYSVAARLVQAGFKHLVLGRLKQGADGIELVLGRFDCHSQARLALQQTSLPQRPMEAVAFLRNILSLLLSKPHEPHSQVVEATFLEIQASTSVAKDTLPEAKPPIYKNPYFWTAVGAGGLALGLMLYFLIPRTADRNTSQILLEW